jgi:hypothetical protein
MRLVNTFLFLLSAPIGLAQVDTLPPASLDPPEELQELIESFFQSEGAEGSFDFNTLFENLEAYQRRPLHLNRASEEDLRDLGLLSDRQIIELLRYRALAGDLISLYELQAIPSFDLSAIRRLLPYVTVGAELDDYRVSLPEMFAAGNNELYLRWSRIVERQRGYQPLAPGQTGARYLGDPNQLYLRFRHSYSNKLSFGLTAEKDRGEEFFRGSNPQGFDFYSFHVFLRDYNKLIKAVALGDYSISFGQGLILFSGFGYGKGAATTTLRRSSRAVGPYTSVNEAAFFRGAATTLALSSNLELTALVSARRRDGSLVRPDTADSDAAEPVFTSLGYSGLHRTPSEIANKNVIGQFSTGGSLKYRLSRGHVALNALYDRFDLTFSRRPRPYNRFFFSGRSLFNASVDYAWVYRNAHFFGETAMSDNGVVATLNGLLLGLDRRVDLALLFRHYPRDYQALNANPFGETTGGRNETGVYLGLEVRPHRYWTLNAYFDAWRHPWLRFGVDAPSAGHEFRGRLTYYRRRALRAYIEVFGEVKERNQRAHGMAIAPLVPQQRYQTRLHVAPVISKSLEIRTRLDWGAAKSDGQDSPSGFVMLQDVIFKPMQFPLSFSTRFAIFDTPGFDVRFYHYENDLLYTFSIPAYYNRGTRFYLNLRYRPVKTFTVEARVAQTYWANQPTIGSGLETIEGPARTQVSAQIRYQFSRGL